MATTKKRLFGPALLTNTTATKYTVPGSTSAVVRRIRFSNSDGGAYTITMSIGADAAGTRLFEGVSVPAAGLDVWGPFNLAAAEIIAAHCSTTNKVVMQIDGEETD